MDCFVFMTNPALQIKGHFVLIMSQLKSANDPHNMAKAKSCHTVPSQTHALSFDKQIVAEGIEQNRDNCCTILTAKNA